MSRNVTDGGRFPEQNPADEQGVVVKRRSRGRRRRWYQKAPLWWQEYRVEMGLATAVLIAIFLLVEPWDIRESLFAFTRRLMSALSSTVGEAGRAVFDWMRSLTLSDATAVVILMGVVFAAAWRVRWRVMRSERFWSSHCPQCDSTELHRIRRRFPDRLLGKLGFPVRRYRCSGCGWQGLRIYKKGSAVASLPEPPAAA